ncbi:transposase [Methylovulum miyakonense]|uniref:transposase n=1 Tax=Methylovulum miyakonense TaxID=645578 RepID=UPI001E3387A4|nr:transposase [Methylovulum miyakonense]
MGYPSDLTDKEWGLIKHYFEPEDPRGNACKHDRKQVVDAIFYWAKSGVQWRMLPNDFPPWKTVYDHYSRWNKGGDAEKPERAMPEGSRAEPRAELRHHRFAKRKDPVQRRRARD